MSESNSDAPIRIAFVITELEFGGAERNLVRIAAGLDRSAFAPSVIALAGPPVGDSRLVGELGAANVPTTFLDAHSIWHAPRAFLRLRRALASHSPEIVQSFLFHANVMAAAAAPVGAPRVLGVRVADPRRARARGEQWAARGARAVVCVSGRVRDALVRNRTCRADQAIVIPNGVDVESIVRTPPADLAREGIPPNTPILLYVGRYDHQKGIDWLRAMSRAMLERLTHHHLVLVGDPTPQGDAARRAWNASHSAERVHHLGWRADVPALLRRADLLVVPSRWEGMPNAVLEAMAAGIPVLATDAEGVGEALGPLADEQTIAFGQTERWLERLESIATDPATRTRLGQSNQRRAAASFSAAAMVARHAELYSRLARRERPPSLT
ncbi:MAG: glycosyltransferase [Planctomycetes bacterium]|nr:glycosyltransferase [Planctomycetota bacterium]